MHVNVRKGSIVCILFFFSLRTSATPIPVLSTESAILNTPTKGTDVFFASGYTGENCEKGKCEPTFKNSIVLLTTAAEER